MSFKQRIARITGLTETMLPAGYQIVGDVLLVKLPKLKKIEQKRLFAEAALKILPYVKTICEIMEIKGEFREPKICVLAGTKTETIHTENGIKYKFDAAKLMFSKGNLAERKRLIPQIKENDIIVDMFAGIGYFSLGIAKLTAAREIIAIEKNPVAYNFLVHNITLNGLHNVNALQGDCKTAALGLRNIADHVIMGYFPGTEEFLPYALLIARKNGVIHYHNIYREKDLWKLPIKQIEEACKKISCHFEVIRKKKVKSFSPKIWHVVVDFQVTKE